MSIVVDVNKITEAIIGAAIEGLKRLGPGLPELAYRACLVGQRHNSHLMWRFVTNLRPLPRPGEVAAKSRRAGSEG